MTPSRLVVLCCLWQVGVAAAEVEKKESPSGHAFDEHVVRELATKAMRQGDVVRGAAVFASAKSACLSCHRVGNHGGVVGPELTQIARERKIEQLVTSLLWPQRDVDPKYVVWQITTADGKILSGYRVREDTESLELRDLSTNGLVRIAKEDVEEQIAGSTPMPEQLVAGMTEQQQLDLVKFLVELKHAQLSPESSAVLSASHGPQTFPFVNAPLHPEDWPNSGYAVNQHRLYDFYTKQAEYFRRQPSRPMVVAPFPGLDGGAAGHWGYQTERSWMDDRWNDAKLGSVQAGVFFGGGESVARGVCVRLGNGGELSVCFDPDTLTYVAAWQGGFVRFSATRHGFVHGLRPIGKSVSLSQQDRPSDRFEYHGFFRHGPRIVFSYRIGDQEYLDSPWVDEQGAFTRELALVHRHSLKQAIQGGPVQWPQEMHTKLIAGEGRPYAIDTIQVPFENPWNVPMFFGGHDFLADGSAMICTIQGDVWHVTGLDAEFDGDATVTWRRFASGLNHALGLVVVNDDVFVQCRDQLTRLQDKNGDGEADFYECFNNTFETSPAGHDFICGLDRDSAGNFYTAIGNQGIVKISADGKESRVIATGLRNPDGIAVLPDGTVTAPCSEGEWTPASMIVAVPPNHLDSDQAIVPHFGYRGPQAGRTPSLPLAYLPRGLDNSSGGQVTVDSDRWGPLQGQVLHLSFGMGRHFLVLRDQVDGQSQAAIVPLVGDFRSGVHRGRFRRQDGQLYVSGMDGWVSFTPDDGCFQRVRYTGEPVQVPVGFHLYENGVSVKFAEDLDSGVAEQVDRHFVQVWNYRYSSAYGSPEFSPSHHGIPGHDPLEISSAYILDDGRTLFLELPELQPVSQLHLRLHVNAPTAAGQLDGHDLFVTAHRLDEPFRDFSGYVAREKHIAAHPILSDMALSKKRRPNPWLKRIPKARRIEIETGQNLSYKTRQLQVRAGEPLRLTLSNPDVVPHNWALIRSGTLAEVGKLANQLISDPESVIRQYIPKTDDVLVFTDVVPPGGQFSVFFYAPDEPGDYPFLCTFPGHWMVMNGVLHVVH